MKKYKQYEEIDLTNLQDCAFTPESIPRAERPLAANSDIIKAIRLQEGVQEGNTEGFVTDSYDIKDKEPSIDQKWRKREGSLKAIRKRNYDIRF
jgi:hypothetical protein